VEAEAGPARFPAIALTRLNLCGVPLPRCHRRILPPRPTTPDKIRLQIMGPARCQYDVARRGQPLEANIAVDLEHTTGVLEMGRRTLALRSGL
jgi:hypothetical protein